MLRFATFKKRKKGLRTLFEIKQGVDETLGNYIDRFQEKALNIQEVNDFILQLVLTCELWEGLFSMEVAGTSRSRLKN